MHREHDEAALDDLLRAALVVEPPAAVQRKLLASALRVADGLAAARPEPTEARPRRVPLVAYVLLGLLVALYAGLLGPVWGWEGPGAFAGEAILSIRILLSSPLTWIIADLVERATDQIVWALVAPLVWYLWQSDRAAAGQS